MFQNFDNAIRYLTEYKKCNIINTNKLRLMGGN